MGVCEGVGVGASDPAPAVARRWADYLEWHPWLPLTWPSLPKSARHKLAEWRVKEAGVRVEVGADGTAPGPDLEDLKVEAPDLAPSIRVVEAARERAAHDAAWKALRAEAGVAGERPEAALEGVRGFLRAYPDSPHRPEAKALLGELASRLAERQDRQDRDELGLIRRGATLPEADLAELIRQAQEFLSRHPESRQAAEARKLQDELVVKLDERDIEKARQFSRQHPGRNFAARIARFQGYLEAHKGGGKFVRA